MHTRDRAYRCQTRKCGSLSSRKVTRPKSVVFKRSGEDDQTKTAGKSRSTKNSPERCPSGELADHESTLNLMSETLMSVAEKLEKVFNNPKEWRPVSRPTIKRVYVIKFDEKGSEVKKHTPNTCKRHTKVVSDCKRRMKRHSEANLVVDKCRRVADVPTKIVMDDDTLYSSKSVDDNDNTIAFSDDYERSSNDRIRSPKDRRPCQFQTKGKLLSPEDSFSNLINDVTSPPERRDRPATGSGRKPGFNYKVLFREKIPRKDPRKNCIPDIFNAILKEIGSISLKNRKTTERQRQKPESSRNPRIKTLSEVLESEESLITAEYTIPRSMIKKEAIERLQTLLDRANKKSQTGRSIASVRDDSVVLKDSESVEWKEPERLPTAMSYFTRVINDHEAANDIDASSSVVSGPICRICHGRHGTLVKPCQCRGTLAYVHVECLQVWLTEKEVNFCELCNFTFRVIHVPEYKIIPSIGFWYKFAATNQQRRMMMVDLTLAIVLLPFLIFLTIFVRSFTSNAKTEYEEDEDFEENIVWDFGQATIKVAMFLVILSYVAGVLIRINHHLTSWFSWYVNKNVTVVLEDRRQSRDDEVPKLEKLASSLTGIDLPSSQSLKDGRESPAPKSSRRGASRRRSKKSKKLVLVKKPAIPETPPMANVIPQFPQPGMVYVPASWIKNNPMKPPKKRRSVDFSEKHTLASLAKRRHTAVEQNILVQQKPGKSHKTIKKRLMLRDNSETPITDLAMSVNAKRAALALERKRLEFLQYLQEVQDEISALEFASGQKLTKIRSNKNKKRDAVTLKSKSKKNRTDSPKPAGKPKTKNTGTLKKKPSKVEHSKNPVKPVASKVVKSKQSLTSMLSQDSSSSTQIKMMDDAFNSNHRNYKVSMNESKQTRINVGHTSVTELPGFFQWNPIPNCRSTNSAIKLP